MKINGKIISEPKSKLTIKNDPYLTFKMKFNKNKWDIKFMSIVCFINCTYANTLHQKCKITQYLQY